MSKKRAIVSVTNDLSNDRRVDNTCRLLMEVGFDVLLVGRKQKASKPLAERSYRTYRFSMVFQRKVWFYAAYNVRLFYYLLFRKFDLLVANDLDTLWANRVIARLRAKPLVYDTHEFYTGTPELAERPRVRGVWQSIERRIFPKLQHIITVNASIAGLYRDLYHKDLMVIRNVPPLRETAKPIPREELGLPADVPVILLQGAWINVDRGGEEAVAAMEFIENAVLLVVGGGDAIARLKEIAQREKVRGKVFFMDRQPFERLSRITAIASLGLSLDKDTNINYRFSLPNKLFDYIHAGVPVIASNLVEVRRIVETYEVGWIVPDHQPESIAAVINEALSDPSRLKQMREHCARAKNELCWDKEKEKAEVLYRSFV